MNLKKWIWESITKNQELYTWQDYLKDLNSPKKLSDNCLDERALQQKCVALLKSARLFQRRHAKQSRILVTAAVKWRQVFSLMKILPDPMQNPWKHLWHQNIPSSDKNIYLTDTSTWISKAFQIQPDEGIIINIFTIASSVLEALEAFSTRLKVIDDN